MPLLSDLGSIAIIVTLIGTYIVISSEKLHRTVAALLGASVMGLIVVTTGLAEYNELVSHVDWTTILFIASMMIVVSVAARSGMFQFLATSVIITVHGNIKSLYLTFAGMTFLFSIFFDTITTMLIIGPLTVEICKGLDYDFRPFLTTEAIISNFGSIPSLVGSVPNMVIGEHAALTVVDLGVVLGPLSIILFLVSIPIFLWYFSDQLEEDTPDTREGVLILAPKEMIEDSRMFWMTVVAIVGLALGFVIGQPFLGLDPSLVALAAAAFLLVFSGEHPEESFAEIEWNSVFFIIGLFLLIGGVEIAGLIDLIADEFSARTQANPTVGLLLLIWLSGILSAVIDNIPISVAMAPIALKMGVTSPLIPLALAFATNIGGYILPIGSPANILAIAISEREKRPITFKSFLKIGALMGLLHLLIGTIYLALLFQFF